MTGDVARMARNPTGCSPRLICARLQAVNSRDFLLENFDEAVDDGNLPFVCTDVLFFVFRNGRHEGREEKHRSGLRSTGTEEATVFAIPRTRLLLITA